MIPEWVWALAGGAVVSAAGFWAKSMMNQVRSIALSLAKIEQGFRDHGGRLERIEDFIDKFAERRTK